MNQRQKSLIRDPKKPTCRRNKIGIIVGQLRCFLIHLFPVQGAGCHLQSSSWLGTTLFVEPSYPGHIYPIHQSGEAENAMGVLY